MPAPSAAMVAIRHRLYVASTTSSLVSAGLLAGPAAAAPLRRFFLRPAVGLEAWPVGLLVEELAHPPLAAFLAIDEAQLDRLRRKIVERGFLAHAAHVLDRLLGGADGLGIEFHQPLRQRHGLGPQLLARHGAIDQPGALGDAAVESLARHREPHGVAHAERLHQRLADEAARQDAPVNLGKAKLRVLGRDREVAGDELGEATAEAEAVDHRDGRLGIGEELLPAPVMAGGARPRALDRLVVEIAEEQLEVLSGAPSRWSTASASAVASPSRSR